MIATIKTVIQTNLNKFHSFIFENNAKKKKNSENNTKITQKLDKKIWKKMEKNGKNDCWKEQKNHYK